ncbi:PREDICTED: eukaryotic translation initiation factor 3 subunit M [Camelina sativa]|uniref:Eukaryotic translation initiation factor 3 subunit M n=1 Tax=Camelina sativa TaxID=90675 RepID=A0ABM0XXH2_CAMSA|nr:PREDICTED: eukaryotic translation initiation factor 3 subunit M [Camelina sativa]
MTTIVPTSEEDPSLAIVRFTSQLAWADAGPEVSEPQVSRLCREAEESIRDCRWLDLATLMVTSADLVSTKISEKDLECTYTIICSLVKNVKTPEEVLEMVKAITSKVVQQPDDKASLRLKILFNLYNMLDHPNARFQVYMKALELAVNGKITEYIVPSFKKIDSFLKDWNIDIKDQREVFLAIPKVLRENKSLAEESLQFVTKYLATFSNEDAQVMSEAKEEAVRAIIEFFKAPSIFQCDLLDMPAVVQLEKDPNNALVYHLLKIFLTQRLDAYMEFQNANSGFLQTYGLVEEDCVAKMRLLSLVDLASDESGKISYASIKNTLQVNEEEVELWVVKAITAKLVDCKMDQMNQVVIVSRCAERDFGQKQWQSLRTKLAAWRDNITNVINTIQANKVTEEASSGTQGLTVR